MARSYKKANYCGERKRSFVKRWANRRVRHDKNVYSHNSYKKIFDSYEICDYKSFCYNYESFREEEIRSEIWYISKFGTGTYRHRTNTEIPTEKEIRDRFNSYYKRK